MTDYEYILERITKHDEFHWDNGVVEGIISKTGLLSDEELCDITQAIEDHKSWDLTYWPDYITSWNWEVCYKISKSVMKKISTHKLIDLFYTKSPDTCCYRSSLSMWILHDTRSELRRRYNCGIDSYLIARVFIDANDENSVWLKWQKRKKKVAITRYKNSTVKKMEDYEKFVDEEFIEDSPFWFDDVIWIKCNNDFFDKGNRRLNAVIDKLQFNHRINTQYVGIGRDIWLGVVDRELFKDNTSNVFYNEVDYEMYKKRLAMGCLSVEKFVQQTIPKISVSARVCKKSYLLGKFVLPIDVFSVFYSL